MSEIAGSLLILAIVIYGLVLMVSGPANANKLMRWVFRQLWRATKRVFRWFGELMRWGMIRVGAFIGRFGRRYPLATGIIFSLMLIATILFFYILLSG